MISPTFNRGFRRFITLLRFLFVTCFVAMVWGLDGAIIAFLVVGALLGAIMSWGMFVPQSTLFGTVFSGISTESKVIALTFDDGPNTESTPQLLSLLESYGVQATFFLVGKKAQATPELTRKIADKGHQVENHTWSHHPLFAMFPLFTKQKVRDELLKCNAVLKELCQKEPHLVRFPAGVKSFPAMEAACELGMLPTAFNVRPFDGCGSVSADKLFKRITAHIRPGAMLVLHDRAYKSAPEAAQNRQSVEQRNPMLTMLPQLFHWLSEKGYQCVTVDELLLMEQGD